MNEKQDKLTPTQLPGRRVFIVIVIVLIVGAFSALQTYRWRTPRELTPQDVTDIIAAIRQSTNTPVQSMTPNRDGTVGVFAGQSDQPGGQLFHVKNTDGAWLIAERTLLF